MHGNTTTLSKLMMLNDKHFCHNFFMQQHSNTWTVCCSKMSHWQCFSWNNESNHKPNATKALKLQKMHSNIVTLPKMVCCDKNTTIVFHTDDTVSWIAVILMQEKWCLKCWSKMGVLQTNVC